MKRLIKKSNVMGSFTFDEVRQYINEKTPYALFDLNLEEQEKLSKVLDAFELGVNDASNYSGFGIPRLEVGVVSYDNIAYYDPGSEILTLNEGSLNKLFSASSDYVEMVAVHEYGHYVDEKLGDISQTQSWKQVIDSSSTDYLEGYGITATTNMAAEQFANVFISCVWGTQQDECTEFIQKALKG